MLCLYCLLGHFIKPYPAYLWIIALSEAYKDSYSNGAFYCSIYHYLYVHFHFKAFVIYAYINSCHLCLSLTSKEALLNQILNDAEGCREMDEFLSPGPPAAIDDEDEDDIVSADVAPIIQLPEDDDDHADDFAPSPRRSEGDGREDPDGTDG